MRIALVSTVLFLSAGAALAQTREAGPWWPHPTWGRGDQANIDRVYPGGFAAFKRENASLFGGRLWHDQHLLRDGAMSARDAHEAVDSWRRHGLEPTETEEGRQRWKDVCVVEHMLGGLTLPCDWLEFDRARGCVSLKGTPSEVIVGREQFRGIEE